MRQKTVQAGHTRIRDAPAGEPPESERAETLQGHGDVCRPCGNDHGLALPGEGLSQERAHPLCEATVKKQLRLRPVASCGEVFC